MADLRYINGRGLVVPDTSDTRADVVSEFRTLFGQDVITEPETPQGVLITMLAQERDHTARVMAEVANQINPAKSQGVFLDGIMALMGAQRFAATHSTIANVRLGGVPGTIIQANALITSDNQDEFRTTSTVIINNQGQTFVDVRAVTPGPIEVSRGQLTTIAETVLGWETVYNENSAVVGRNQESDTRLRNRRRNVLALSTTSTNEAIISRLYDIPEVQSLSYRENFTSSTISIEGVNLKPHSIYVCVNGGIDVDIANVLLRTKTIGAGYNGQISVRITDEISEQPYIINFDRAETITLFLRVTVTSSHVNAQTVIREAVRMMNSGEIEGDPGLIVGRNISPFEISAAINFTEPSIYIKKIELSTDGETWSSEEKNIRLNQIADIPVNAIQVITQ